MLNERTTMEREAAAIVTDARAAIDNPRKTYGISYGMDTLDRALGGAHPGELMIVAARPGIGKSSLVSKMAYGVAKTLASEGKKGEVVALFSLEMSTKSILARMACQIARVNQRSLKLGTASFQELDRVEKALKQILTLPLIINSTSSATVKYIEARVEDWKSQGLHVALLAIDYLGIMGDVNRDTMSQTINSLGGITGRLKGIAMRDATAVCALSQLARSAEESEGRKPELRHLRDCLPADSLVLNADTGERVPVIDIVNGRRFNVWALNPEWKLVKRPITAAWYVNDQTVYRTTTRTGRVFRCTANHKLLGETGWKPLQEFAVGDLLAAPRGYPEMGTATMTEDQALLLGMLLGNGHMKGSVSLSLPDEDVAQQAAELANKEFGLHSYHIPCPHGTKSFLVHFPAYNGRSGNPLINWLKELGCWQKTAEHKRIPDEVWQQPSSVIAACLRGLYHTDGTCPKGDKQRVKFVSISQGLVMDVQHALLRLGIIGSVRSEAHGTSGYPTPHDRIWVIDIALVEHVETFLKLVGFLGQKHEGAVSRFKVKTSGSAGIDRLPFAVNEHSDQLKAKLGLGHAPYGWRNQNKRMSRETAVMLADRHGDETLRRWGTSDIVWDEIKEIEECGVEAVYDLTVDVDHNFVANDVNWSNSGHLEQDADRVLFIHRPAAYDDKKSMQPHDTTIIVAKAREDQTGGFRLTFSPAYTDFSDPQ